MTGNLKLNKDMVVTAVGQAFVKLDPRIQVKNPVMFIVMVGAVITTIFFVRELAEGNSQEGWFELQIALWLWFTVLFANFAEAIAEARGKAQADSLRKTREETPAKLENGETISSNDAQAYKMCEASFAPIPEVFR